MQTLSEGPRRVGREGASGFDEARSDHPGPDELSAFLHQRRAWRIAMAPFLATFHHTPREHQATGSAARPLVSAKRDLRLPGSWLASIVSLSRPVSSLGAKASRASTPGSLGKVFEAAPAFGQGRCARTSSRC